MVVERKRIAVLGGSSVGTPLLVEALARAQAAGRLPPLEIRLFGRAHDRLPRIAQHAHYRLQKLELGPGGQPHDIEICLNSSVQEAVRGADLVLCQIRVGGFEGRAGDEMLALREGIPADEGIGPSGLACYLRGRSTIARISRTVAALCPEAPLLMMTSPLGLNVALARRAGASRCYGVCELTSTTASKVCASIGEALGTRLTAQHVGLNHQGWLHYFEDASGADRTSEALRAIRDPALVSVDPEVIRRVGAVPLPYMNLYYHTSRELHRQKRSPKTRGEELLEWFDRAERAYLDGRRANDDLLLSVLAERKMNWYNDGVVPAVVAFLGNLQTIVSLNLPSNGALAGVDPEAVVEMPCAVSANCLAGLHIRPLPRECHRLLMELIDYESAVLDLNEELAGRRLVDALELHPLVNNGGTARSLASRLIEMVQKGIKHSG